MRRDGELASVLHQSEIVVVDGDRNIPLRRLARGQDRRLRLGERGRCGEGGKQDELTHRRSPLRTGVENVTLSPSLSSHGARKEKGGRHKAAAFSCASETAQAAGAISASPSPRGRRLRRRGALPSPS